MKPLHYHWSDTKKCPGTEQEDWQVGVADTSATFPRVLSASRGRAKLRGASGNSVKGLGMSSSSPSSRFAGLSSTIRGHSHPTVRKRTGERRRSKTGPFLIQQQPLQCFIYSKGWQETLYTQLEYPVGEPCNPHPIHIVIRIQVVEKLTLKLVVFQQDTVSSVISPRCMQTRVTPWSQPGSTLLGLDVWSGVSEIVSSTSTDKLVSAPQRSPLHCFSVTSSHVRGIITRTKKYKMKGWNSKM